MLEELKKIIDEIEKKIEFDPSNEYNYKTLIYSYPELDCVQSRCLFMLYKKTNDKDIRNIIFRCHLRYVYDICKEVNGYKMDLISEGNVLLLQELEKYDYHMHYTDFLKELKQKLNCFYKSMLNNNDAFNHTRMSTYDLACLEENGKILTESNEELNEQGKLTNECKEKLIIVSSKENYFISKKDGEEIFKKIFKGNSKDKKIVLKNKFKSDDLDY